VAAGHLTLAPQVTVPAAPDEGCFICKIYVAPSCAFDGVKVLAPLAN